MASEVQRLNEPSIVTPATRAADMAGRIEAGRLRQQEDQLMRQRDKQIRSQLGRGNKKKQSLFTLPKRIQQSETERRNTAAEKRKAERASLFGNRLNATRNR